MSTFGTGCRTSAGSGLSPRFLLGLLIAFYILLPLDTGFPRIPLFGRPLNSAIAATLAVLLALIVQSRGAVLSYLREPYCVIQSIYTSLLVVAALRAPSLLVALHWTALYFCTFVLNYVILRHVTRLHGVHWLSIVTVAVGVAAAAVSIVQGVLGIPLPMYQTWFESHFRTPPPDYALATVRADGTMNNSILYCLLMALVIPYALDVRHKAARAVALFTIMFAAGLSGSRTAVFVVAVFAAGAFAVYRWRAVRALPAVGLGLVLLTVSLGWLTPDEQDSRFTFLVERLGLLVDQSRVTEASRAPNEQEGAASDAEGAGTATLMEPRQAAEVSGALGVSLRQEVVKESLREMTQEWGALTWIVGRGSLTSGSVGTRIRPWYNTVDNVFIRALYERGLSGLVVFSGTFLFFLIATRRVATTTVHWFAPVTLAVAGLSFEWDAFSMFNILAVGSMAVTMWHVEEGRGSLEPKLGVPDGWRPPRWNSVEPHDSLKTKQA